ncbi:HECT domain-containing protein [Phytophthora infestans]|uniref:HECT domain-containing protein n=1 Tax=Phytophthora infestans TaxID=4787 RepID=A0A833VUM6_PHYIN|nr:HECT domain-containing protein [Phytophthora infestans]
MGTQASRDVDAAANAVGPAALQDEQMSVRAWRTGVPFTLLHDEGFVVEKFQELLVTSNAQQSNKAVGEAQTTVSGLDEASMDEIQHATDMARIKLFARTKRDSGTGGQCSSRPASPSSLGPGAASMLTSSTVTENPPSALAGMAGNTLSRESPESVDSERLRSQRDKLLQIYYEQIAARMRQKHIEDGEETTRTRGLQGAEGSLSLNIPSGSVVMPPPPDVQITRKRHEISQHVTATSVFTVGSLRMQLEMLREFRVLSPKLFESGTMTLVQTLLDSPPFALQDVVADSPEDTLLSDVHRFCRDVLHPEQGTQAPSDIQRQVALLLLFAIGVSSGRIRLLLEFVEELLTQSYESATTKPLLVQGYPFTAWVKVFMQRMQSYRIDYALGTFEDSAFVKELAIKTLPGDPEDDEAGNTSDEFSATLTSSFAMDGSYAYTWSITKGLAMIGTGHNFTIAGRVYAEVPASEYLRRLEEKRTIRKLVYGFGDCIKDVSELARSELGRDHVESSGTSVQDIFGALGASSDGSRLLVSYHVDDVQDVCILENRDLFILPVPSTENGDADVKVYRAWYGELDVLNTEAVLHFCNLLEQKRSKSVTNSNVTLSRDLTEQLLTLSGISLEKIADSKRLMVVFACGDNLDSVGAQVLAEGDQFVEVEERASDSYLSSLLFCDDSLYLSVMYPEIDVSGMLIDESYQRCRRLLRISPQGLGFLEYFPLGKDCPRAHDKKCELPLYAYATEGKLIYEIDMGSSEIVVNVITPKSLSGGRKVLEVTRHFVLNEKTVLCREFLLCLTKIRSVIMDNEDKLDVQLPLFYTNGASLGMLLVDPTLQESEQNHVHCVLFDCESGLAKELRENEERTSCLECSLSCTSACFDARNNLLWLYDEHKRTLRSYQNSGKRIPLDENSIPSVVVSKKTGDGEEPSSIETTALSVLGFVYKNAVSSDLTVGNDADNNSAIRVPFAVDVEVETFRLLLAFTSRYVDIFKANNASIVQIYILQACLGILNKNLESLLQLADGHCKQESISLLKSSLSTPLDKLLEFSSEQPDRKDIASGANVPSGGPVPLQADERSHVQVASVALDLYTTSIRIFHSDVTKQFTHVLRYLQSWQQAKTTRMELKILARLLAHLCTRADVIYHSMVASEDSLEQFLKLVEFAVGMQQRKLRQAFGDSRDMSNDAVTAPALRDSSESPFELISLVNAITQASFVSLCAVGDDTCSRQALGVALVVLEAVRDACSSICSDLADQVKHTDCQSLWTELESIVKDSFVGILTPVVLSSGMMLLRNRKSIEDLLMTNETSEKAESRSEQTSRGLNGSATNAISATSLRLFDFLKGNSSKMLELMVNLDVLVSMIDPKKREHVMENVSMAVKSETMESSHEYENNLDTLTELQVPGATRMVITFDPRSRSEVNYDYLTFYKDKSQGEYYGSQFYSGRDSEQNWPGVGDNPPLIIESDHCFVYFHTDGSNTDWGYKFTATAEILERKKSLQQHWIVFLLESVVHLLDESIKILVDGSVFAPIDDMEVQNEQYLQSDLLRSGVCNEDNMNAEVLRLLQDFVDLPASSDAERVIQALQERSGVSRPSLALARSTSFDQITSSAPNKSVNSAVRAVAAAIFHHNMWGMDAYAFTQNLRDDISEQLLRGWKNAQKMRDWFHLGDAADAGQMASSRRRSGRLRRQPSAYMGLSEESLAILCDNVIKRAQFLLEITPVSFSYVAGAKRRWGLLAKYGHAIGKQNSTDSQLDKWYNLLDELQAATELRSLFQYRRSSSERLKYGQAKSVTEQVLEFIQSDVDISEVRKVIEMRNRRAECRALGMEIFIQSLKDCPSLRMRGVLLESFTSTLKCFAIANSPTNVSGSSSVSPTSALESFPRLHFDALLSGCDEALRQRIAEAFGNCLAVFAKQAASVADDGTSSGLVTCMLRCCAMDYDLEDSYLLQESRVLPQILRLLSSDSITTRNAAQSLLGVLLSRFIAGRVESNSEGDDDGDEHDVGDAHDISAFQRQLFAAVGHQLECIVSSIKSALSSHDRGLGKSFPQYLPENSPGFISSCLQRSAVSWNHSIMLWVYCPSKGPLYALKLGDEVRRGPNWSGTDESGEDGETEIGTVISIPTPTKVHVRWNSSGLTSQCDFDPKHGKFDVVLVDEGVGGTIFLKGNKNMIKDSAAAKPWSHFGLFLTDSRMLVYKIACGSDKESVFETDCELDADQWSHVAIVQDEDTLRVYVNGLMVSLHILESFLVMNANVNPAESAIIESTHPLEDSIDEYCPVHIPGAVKIRLTFDPLCDIDGSTGFVRFYKDAKCVEYWGEEKYTGKYSDPERNFPGAQSNRARLQHADASNVDLNVLEIPSDRFLVYFHNEGSSNSWGFRILASPELATSEEESTSPVTHLNPYPFYFGEAPGRVLDEPAAKCWIYQPKVLSYPISESDLTSEIQTSFPLTDIASNVAPAERTLYILGLFRTCAETSFGRSLIGTPGNLRNILLLSFDNLVPVEIRIGAIKVLKDLVGILSTDDMDTQVATALPGETDGFLPFVFQRLGRALNVWRAFEDDKVTLAREIEEEDADGDQLELRTSAQGEASLVAAYVSLLRGAAEHSCWGDQVFELVISGLQSVQTLRDKWSESKVEQILASLALLGGNYGGAYIGGRVSCCVNVDGKEMIETGYLVQFRIKSGNQTARVIFDCDQSNIVDVPLTDVAHLDDIEKKELASFLKGVTPFASGLKDLYQGVLDLTDASPSVDSYQPKLTKKENVEVLESEHPYAPGEDVTYSLNFRGATEIEIRFDKLSCTAGPNDYIQFKKKEEDLNEGGGNVEKYWGEEKYYGESFPGVGTTPPLRIPAGSVDVHFYTEGSSSGISEWGFKLTAHAFEEALIYPPEIPPTIRTSALSDIRARCITSFGQVLQSLKRSEIVPTFTSLLPSLTKIANTPCDGRPIQSSPKSQVFESKHPYANSVMEYMKVTFNGASALTITFDSQSRTEQGCDYLCFFKDKSLTDRWGAYQYCGVGSDANWPGVEDRPPLVIPADSFTLLWATDGSNVDWGWKFNVTAEFLPEYPLDKSLKQLDARSYRLFETLYEKMSHQRTPLKSEFEEFAGSDHSFKDKHTSDPVRQLLLDCSSSESVRLDGWGSVTSRSSQSFRVIDAAGIKIYQERNRDSNVLAELKVGAEFVAVVDLDGWLKVTSDNIDQLNKATCGWVWQRTGDTVHASPSTACANGEDLLTLGVDDLSFESRHSVLEMDERNDEEQLLTGLCSAYAFDEFKGQTDRIQSLAYDSHRAVATKAARDAIFTFLSCDPKRASIPLSAFGNAEDIFLLLSHFFIGADADTAFDNHSGVLLALRKRLQQMVRSGDDDAIISAVLVRCLEILKSGPQLMPKGRGAVRVLESTHPYPDNADQYWDVSIPGATKIKVVFDRRCKSEAGCDWVRLNKSGSNRTEIIGPDQIGGQGDSENWPGTGDRPPLYIEDDSFEVYFHSDSSNNDWGFKLYAIGVFKEEGKVSRTDIKNPDTVVQLLSMTGWMLEALTSIPDASFCASPATLKLLYSAETLQTLMFCLNESPQSIKTCALEILRNMAQSAAFHTIPAVLVEHLRDLLNVKMRAKHQAEERVELKSPYLQTLVQCAVALDLSMDSHCFGGSTTSAMEPLSLLPFEPGTDGVSTFISGPSASTSRCYQFLLKFAKLASAMTIGLTIGEPEITMGVSAGFVVWEDNGKLSFGARSKASDGPALNEIRGYKSRIREGDTVIILLDLPRQMLVIRKNGIVAALVAGPPGSGALVPWDELYPTLQPESDIRLVVSHSCFDNRIEFSSLSCSSIALIPQSRVPNWYGKVVDAVSMMLDFRENLSSTVISRESRHPLASSAPSKPVRELVDINGAVALEIRFDKRTKLQKRDELRFFAGNEVEASSEDAGNPVVVLSGINGEQDVTESPHLFASDCMNQSNYSLSIGDLVVRSHDWEYSNEDGGAGNAGVVQEVTSWGSHGGKGVRVRWQENGFETVYRYGVNGRYDVQNLEHTKYRSAPLILRGSTISFEFARSTLPTTTALNLSASSDFAGSLELDGTMRLDLKLVEENERVLSKSDCSAEFWACISTDIFEKVDDSAYMEVLRIDGTRGRVILLSDRLGRCTLVLQAVDTSGALMKHHQCRQDADSDSAGSGNLVFGQWIHLALVFSGSRVLVMRNGNIIYSARCLEHDRLVLDSNSALIFGASCSRATLPNDDLPLSFLAFRGHLYDIRLWDVAFRVEQLRSHYRGLDSVDVVPKSSSRPGTPTSASKRPLSPAMTFFSSPRSPRSSLRPVTVPHHMRKWVTTNRTSKDISTVRLNCSVKASPLSNGDGKPSDTAYYEAHVLSSGKVCVGWILGGANMHSKSGIIGEERNSFGIDLSKKVAHFSALSKDLAPFTRVDASACSSPRRSFGNSFGNDIFCRNGDVIGCAINLATGKLTFYVNGTIVAECVPSVDQSTETALLDTKDQEFNALVTEIITVDESATSPGVDKRFYPSASLGPQGAQGLAWNFGQRPFKYEPSIEEGGVLSLLQASDCAEENAHFEVYDCDEQQWDRVVYRHKVQEITPRLVGWWKLNEGVGNSVDDASGNCQQGLIAANNDTASKSKASIFARVLEDTGENAWWNETCSPPPAARRRVGDGNSASPFFSFGSANDAATKRDSLWGYKFYVIPHFSMETVGRRRFQSQSVRFGDSLHNLLPRHDQQLIKYINKKGQRKDLNAAQLLHGPWSDIAPQENELVRWPALMEIIASPSDDAKMEKSEGKPDSSRSGDATASTKPLVDAHGRLSKRFKVLQEFNAAVYRILPFIAFHAPRVDTVDFSTTGQKFMLSDLVMEQRHRILSVVKRTVWDSALGRTNESGVSFELTLNRPKAMRFRATGKTDVEGRHTLFSQAFRQLQALDGTHFRREDALYHVTFLGENAQDAGGPYRETFAQYCEELQSSQLPLMLPTPNSQHNVGVGREKWLLSPGAQSSTTLQMLEFLGKLMGASIRSKQYLALNLAPLVWKKLAGERLVLDDLAAVDSMLVNSMSRMRTIDRYGVTEEMFEDIVMETFTTLGADNRVVELKDGGAHLPVTFSSRCEYADLVEQARLHESDDQAQAIFRGLAKVVPAKLLACFSGAELELMVCGSPEVDVNLLEKCTEYSSCSPTDDHIIWFWRALRDFSHEERSAFLRFVWGRSRLPASADEFPQRFKLQSFNMERAGRSVDAYMPVAHTCFFSIEIPAYSSENVLREKLLYAIYNCQEIDGDGDSVAANQLGWEE